MLLRVVDGVVRDHPFRLVVVVPTRVQVPIEAREVAARHVNSNSAVESDGPPQINYSSSSAAIVTLYTFPASIHTWATPYRF